jgi:hypothetical protein
MKNLLFSIVLMTLSLTAFGTEKSTDYTTFTGKYGTKYVYIDGLQRDLFQKFVIKNSKGPKWGTTENVERTTKVDFWEAHTYWSEDGYPYDECPNFTEEDFEYAETEYSFTWEAVKRLSGPKKTVFYFAYFNIHLYGNNSKTCKYIGSSTTYVYLNKYDKKGDLVYLGKLSDKEK